MKNLFLALVGIALLGFSTSWAMADTSTAAPQSGTPQFQHAVLQADGPQAEVQKVWGRHRWGWGGGYWGGSYPYYGSYYRGYYPYYGGYGGYYPYYGGYYGSYYYPRYSYYGGYYPYYGGYWWY
ncbi:MAG: hypothetical protein ABFD16_11100 [Thermoguttaceae bacterium]